MCSTFAEKIGKFSENPGEIPHAGSKSVGSKGLSSFGILMYLADDENIFRMG